MLMRPANLILQNLSWEMWNAIQRDRIIVKTFYGFFTGAKGFPVEPVRLQSFMNAASCPIFRLAYEKYRKENDQK